MMIILSAYDNEHGKITEALRQTRVKNDKVKIVVQETKCLFESLDIKAKVAHKLGDGDHKGF